MLGGLRPHSEGCGLLALERGLDQPFPLPLPGSAARRPLAGGGGGQGGVETDR